jgi:hypothetical protein
MKQRLNKGGVCAQVCIPLAKTVTIQRYAYSSTCISLPICELSKDRPQDAKPEPATIIIYTRARLGLQPLGSQIWGH